MTCCIRRVQWITYLLLAFTLSLLAPSELLAITATQIDDFEDGTVQDWAGSFSGITNQPTGGPMGTDDNYLRIVSTGGGGAGGRMVFYNQMQWTGDYTSIQSITADVLNEGNNDLDLRIAVGSDLFGASETWYASASSFSLPADEPWTKVEFPLSDLVSLSGPDDLSTVLANVDELRILSSTELPDIGIGGRPRGDVIVAQIGIDNIQASLVPEPTSITQVVLGLVFLGAYLSQRQRLAM